MLRRKHIRRIAENSPPEKERRLLAFVNAGQGGGGTQGKRDETERETEQRRKSTEATLGQELRDRGTTRERLTAVLPQVLLKDMEEAFASPELFREAITEENPFRETIVARAQERASGKILIEPGALSLEDQLLEESILPAGERANILRELLTQKPEAVLMLATTVQRKIERYEELLQNVEGKLKELYKRKGITIDSLEQYFREELPGKGAGKNRQELEQILVQTTPNERERTEVRMLLSDAAKGREKIRRFGLGTRPVAEERTEEQEQTWRVEFVAALSRHSVTLRTYLHSELRQRAEGLFEHHTKLRGEIEQSIFEGKKLSRADANAKAMELFGVSIDAIQQTFVEADYPLRKLCDPEFAASDPAREQYLFEAQASLTSLEQIQKEGETTESILAAARARQEELEEWAWKNGSRLRNIRSLEAYPAEVARVKALLGENAWEVISKMHDVLEPYAETLGDQTKIQALRREPEKCIREADLCEWMDEMQPMHTAGVSALRRAKDMREALTRALILAEYGDEFDIEDVRTLEERERGELSPEQITERSAQAQKTLEILEDDLLGEKSQLRSHPVCRMLGVEDGLRMKFGSIRGSLQEAQQHSFARPILRAEIEMEHLAHAERLLRSLEAIQVDSLPDNVDGKYNHDSGMIFVNAHLSEDQRNEAEQHERGHAILDILTRRARVFPFLFIEFIEENQDGPFQKKLQSLREQWGLEGRRAEIEKQYERQGLEKGTVKRWTDLEEMHCLVGELLSSYASWEQRGKPSLTHAATEEQRTEYALFQTLERGRGGEPSSEEISAMKQKPIRRAKLGDVYQLRGGAGDDERVEEGGEEGARQPEAEEEEAPARPRAEDDIRAHDFKADLLAITRNITKMEQFVTAYPSTAGLLANRIRQSQEGLGILEDIFYGKGEARGRPRPDQDIDIAQRFKRAVDELLKYTAKPVKKIQEFDIARLDLTKEPKGKGKTGGFFAGIRFISVLDIVTLYKNTLEDIKTIYQRRQDRLLSEVGDQLWQIFPDHWFYVGQFKQYHKRRYSGAELEAVEKWSKALENDDSRSILDMIPGTNNKDQIRGIIELLSTKRGEMDWNHEGVWRKLSELSGVPMPIEACRRDTILRDRYLRWMITEIWKDQEMYDKWKSSNDGQFKSGKSSFTNTVEDLSNRHGAMPAELESQLKLWVEYKETHDPHLLRDVKPQRYEEVIDYAIRAGKMSMEQKFYYLILGTAEGLLPADRLSVLESAYLNQFPFLDYFYGKNNSIPEFKRLAAQITEHDPATGKRMFRPGIRTTMWLHLENTRELEVKHRIQKGISRMKAEEIDHEDVPFFVSQLDYAGVRTLANVISGSRQKVSQQGWKNAYCGFSSKLKIFGRLAALEHLGIDRVTAADAKDLANTIAAYIDLDNILTRNGYNGDGATRPELTEYDYQSMSPSSDGHTVGQYRSGINGFIRALLQRIGGDVNAELSRDDLWTQHGITLDQYVETQEGGTMRRNTRQDVANKVFQATPAFVKALEKAILRNMGTFRETLAAHADNFHDEGGSAGEVTLGKIEEVLRERGR